MSNLALAGLSDDLLFAAVLLYTAAMLAFAGEQASRRSRRVAEVASVAAALRTAAASRTRMMAGAGGPAVVGAGGPAVVGAGGPAVVGAGGPAVVGAGGPTVAAGGQALAKSPADPPAARRSRAGAAGFALTVFGAVLHVGSVITRGFAADRVPWGNMYEFSSAVALSAVVIFLVLVAGRRVDRALGAFVMVPVVLYLGLAGTVLYTAAGPLVPALDSYWIKIHVFAAVLSSGAFLLSGMVALLYLLRSRHDNQVVEGRAPRFPLSIGAALPPAPALDRVTYGVIAFAFPIWTFAIIAGAIWAESAWGRYWGWDPKETWSFITWVLYAGYLHARATAGWKGSKAAWIAVAAAGALIVDYYVVNIFVVGFHSYA